MSLRRSAEEFRRVAIGRRVAASWLAARCAMEHATEESRKKYLGDHPNADPSNHTVKKTEGGSSSSGGDASSEASKAESRSKETSKHFDEMKALQKKVDNGDEGAKKKFNRAYDKLYESGDTASKAAEKLINKFEGKVPEDSEASHALELLHHATRDWKSNQSDHHQARGQLSHKMTQQAENTHAYATKMDHWISEFQKALKSGD